MIDLTTLRVSLTKHGAHKAAELIKAFPRNGVLDNTSGTYNDININRTQTAKNLSADASGNLPEFWDSIRKLGKLEIDKLVWIAITFSHYDLIRAMQMSQTGLMKGVLYRDAILSGKAFTNFAHIIEELGFRSGEHTPDYIEFDLSPIFVNPELPAYVKQLLSLKLKSAGWDGEGEVIDECVKLFLHEVFAVSKEFFQEWLGKAVESELDVGVVSADDLIEEFQNVQPFHFVQGHNPRAEGEVKANTRQAQRLIRLIHNELQKKLYDHLVITYGKALVGTENVCVYGSVDIVVKLGEGFLFYEIKTSNSVRLCIREALAQLLEYAYWPDGNRAHKLIVVSPNQITKEAEQYLKHLRSTFNIPIYYQQFDPISNILGEIV